MEARELEKRLEVCRRLPLFLQSVIPTPLQMEYTQRELKRMEREAAEEVTGKAEGGHKEKLPIPTRSATTPDWSRDGDPTRTSRPPGPTPPMTTATVMDTPQPGEHENGVCSPSCCDLLLITSWDRMLLLPLDSSPLPVFRRPPLAFLCCILVCARLPLVRRHLLPLPLLFLLLSLKDGL